MRISLHIHKHIYITVFVGFLSLLSYKCMCMNESSMARSRLRVSSFSTRKRHRLSKRSCGNCILCRSIVVLYRTTLHFANVTSIGVVLATRPLQTTLSI